MNGQVTSASNVSAEFEGANLGNARRNKRLIRIVQALVRRPEVGFPQAMPAVSELEAFYRFVESDRIDFDALLAPHARAAAERMQSHPEMVIVHDTTEFRFTTQRDDLGRLRKDSERAKKGFLTHFALALSADEARDPLGVVGACPWLRSAITPSAKRRAGMGYDAGLESEQARWARGVLEVQAKVAEPGRVVHVMDSEADDYALLAALIEQSCRFVIRQCYDRRIDELVSGKPGKMKAFVETAKSVETRTVRVSPRRAATGMKDRRRNLVRAGREATLSFSAASVTLRRPSSAVSDLPETLTLNIVRVWEDTPPLEHEPVEWLLITSEPIETVEKIMRVVDLYRMRWVIEEFFKAIKSGCSFEKRQLESFGTLAVALALFVPIAWFLLRLRSTARSVPSSPAATIVDDIQLEVLRRASNHRLPGVPTVRDVLLAIARLGGHLERNGEPGWQTLGRGYEELRMLEAGFRLAMRSDQS
jgi:hypothetical protein